MAQVKGRVTVKRSDELLADPKWVAEYEKRRQEVEPGWCKESHARISEECQERIRRLRWKKMHDKVKEAHNKKMWEVPMTGMNAKESDGKDEV